MSNYNHSELPPSLAEFSDRISIAAEVVNATGEVKLVFHDGDPDKAGTESVYLHLQTRQARDLAESIFQAACEADWAVTRDRAFHASYQPRYLRCGKPTTLQVDEARAFDGPCVLKPAHKGDCSLVNAVPEP